MEASAAFALVSSGCPGRAVAISPVATTGSAFGECRARFLRRGIGELDLQSQDFRALGEERAIAEQIERRKVQLIAPQPRCERDVGADARGLAGCQRESGLLRSLPSDGHQRHSIIAALRMSFR